MVNVDSIINDLKVKVQKSSDRKFEWDPAFEKNLREQISSALADTDEAKVNPDLISTKILEAMGGVKELPIWEKAIDFFRKNMDTPLPIVTVKEDSFKAPFYAEKIKEACKVEPVAAASTTAAPDTPGAVK